MIGPSRQAKYWKTSGNWFSNIIGAYSIFPQIFKFGYLCGIMTSGQVLWGDIKRPDMKQNNKCPWQFYKKKSILLQSIRICWFTKQFVGLKSPFISCQTDRYQCHWQFQSKNCSKTNWSKAMAFCSFVQDTEQKCWKAEMQILSVKMVNLLLLSMPFKRTHWLIWKLQIKPLLLRMLP